jgi:hypothetical protein
MEKIFKDHLKHSFQNVLSRFCEIAISEGSVEEYQDILRKEIDISRLIPAEGLTDKEQLTKLKEILQQALKTVNANLDVISHRVNPVEKPDPFDKLKQQISDLTVENFPEFVMSFFHSNRSDVQRTWFNFDNPKSKEVAEKINDFIINLTLDQREKIDDEIYDCDLSWSWRWAGKAACLTVGWTETIQPGDL